MRRYVILLMICVLTIQVGYTQRSADIEFDRMMNEILKFSVPILTVKEYKQLVKAEDIVLLDAREVLEYETSHIKGAKHIGYNHFQKDALTGISKDATIVVYCTVGYRSEKIGERLVNMGYKNIYNLYGSIFEWVNQGNEVVDKEGKVTTKVHAYEKDWGKWLKKGIQVYE